MKYSETISCAPVELYSTGGFYDDDIGLDYLIETSRHNTGQIEIIAEIFPAYKVYRSLPVLTVSSDPSFSDAVESLYRGLEARFMRAAPSLLVRIKNAIVWNNMIFAVLGDRVAPIYEFYRPNDRMEKGRNLISRLAACENRSSIDLKNINLLFVGSAGSFNYGHWLVDDFPMFAANFELRQNGQTSVVLMSSYFSDVDRIRLEGAALAFGESANYCVQMLDRSTAYHIKNLHYVTPATYHAHLKNPYALKFIRDTCSQILFDEPSCVNSDKIFINRAGNLPRRIVNNNDVVETLKHLGFAELHPDRLSLREQWATFMKANQVIGIMGAAMTNSLFSPPGAKLTYLAPHGWIEPFYWDLAAMSGHSYAAVFGSTEDSIQDTYRKNFSVDIPSLIQHLSEP